jgi:carbamoylphosphate synthase small subunit
LGGSYNNLFVVFATAHEGKPMLTCYISKEIIQLAKNLNAGQVVRELGKIYPRWRRRSSLSSQLQEVKMLTELQRL